MEEDAWLEEVSSRLPEEERARLEGPFTAEEVWASLAAMKSGKVPGGVGLTAEFFTFFWGSIGEDFREVLGQLWEGGRLSESMRTGNVVLLYKKGDREELGNWRPITLLTVDYKLLAKVLAKRLTSVMSWVVQEDLTCGVPGRSCSLNLALVRDLLAWVKQRRLPLALLALGQEKAFDRVSHLFLFKVLERVNFGPGFVGRVRALYEGAGSVFGVNEWATGVVLQSGGVRQGCPLSPLLYVFCIEPLVSRLRRDGGLKGVHLPGAGGAEVKVLA